MPSPRVATREAREGLKSGLYIGDRAHAALQELNMHLHHTPEFAERIIEISSKQVFFDFEHSNNVLDRPYIAACERDMAPFSHHEHDVDLWTQSTLRVLNEAFDDVQVERGGNSTVEDIAREPLVHGTDSGGVRNMPLRELGGLLFHEFAQECGDARNHQRAPEDATAEPIWQREKP